MHLILPPLLNPSPPLGHPPSAQPQQIVPSTIPGIVLGCIGLLGFLVYLTWVFASCCCACWAAPCCRRGCGCCRRRKGQAPLEADATQQFISAAEAVGGKVGREGRGRVWQCWEKGTKPCAGLLASASQAVFVTLLYAHVFLDCRPRCPTVCRCRRRLLPRRAAAAPGSPGAPCFGRSSWPWAWQVRVEAAFKPCTCRLPGGCSAYELRMCQCDA